MSDENNTNSNADNNAAGQTDNLGNNGEKQPTPETSNSATPVNAEPSTDNTPPAETPIANQENPAPVAATETAPVEPAPQHSPVSQIPFAETVTLVLDGVVRGERTFPKGTSLESAMKEFSTDSFTTFEFQDKASGKKVAKTLTKLDSDLKLDVTKTARGG